MAVDADRGWVPLRGANLCLDCEAVFEGFVCPSCASRNAMPIKRWVVPVDTEEGKSGEEAAPPARWRQAAYALLGVAAGVLIGRSRPG